PDADPVNETVCPTCGLVGLNVKLAVRAGGGGFVTVRDCWEVAVCCGDPLSLAVRATVNVPADASACVAVEPVPVDPSPKVQPNEHGAVPPAAHALTVTCGFV